MLNGPTLIFICQPAGEALMRLAGAPVPGPVAGMVLLLVGLVIAALMTAFLLPPVVQLFTR
jgi:holin-like protein